MRQVGHAAGQLQLLRPGQLTRERRLVDGLVPVGERHRGVVAQLVPFPVEVPGPEHGRDAGDALAVDQQRSDERLLGVGVVGQQSFGVERHLSSPSGPGLSPGLPVVVPGDHHLGHVDEAGVPAVVAAPGTDRVHGPGRGVAHEAAPPVRPAQDLDFK